MEATLFLESSCSLLKTYLQKKVMKKPLLLLFSCMICCLTEAQELTQAFVYFDTDKSTLTDIAQNELLQLIAVQSTKQIQSIQLSGHTDAKGSEVYNLELSKRRVQSVKDFLLSLEIKESILILDYFGETLPVRSNETAQNRQSNRRVEVLITAIALPVETEAVVVDVEVELEEIEEIPKEQMEVKNEVEKENLLTSLAGFKKQPEIFYINNNRDTVLQGAEGTIVFFNAYSFDNRELVGDSVKIELTEYYTAADLILNNLHTQAGNRLLETQGMIRLEAYVNDKKLKLKRGKKVDLFIPDVDQGKGFQLFKGVEKGMDVDWRRDSRSTIMSCLQALSNSNVGGLSIDVCYCRTSFGRWLCNKNITKKCKRLERKRRRNRPMRLINQNTSVDFTAMQGDLSSEKAQKKRLREFCQLFSTPNLGWINCDRFLNLPRRQLATLKVNDKEEALVTVVFKNIKSKMRATNHVNGFYRFKNIPKDRKVWIVSIKEKEDALFLAIQAHNTSKKIVKNLSYKSVSKEELAASLNDFGW